MRRCKLSVFRLLKYEAGSAPDTRTLKKDIERGHIPGGFRDPMTGRYWVDLDVFEGKSPQNEILDAILQDEDVARAILQ